MSLRSVFLRGLVNRRQYFDKVIAAVPVAMQRQVPRTQTFSKTVKVLPAQSIGRVADVPVIMLIIQLPELPATQHIDKEIEEPVAMPRQAPPI